MSSLVNQPLYGYVEARHDSYVVRVYNIINGRADFDPLYVMSFHDGVSAEDRLIDLLEHPAWTLLQYS